MDGASTVDPATSPEVGKEAPSASSDATDRKRLTRIYSARMPDSEPPIEQTELHRAAFTAEYRSLPRILWNDAEGAHEREIDSRAVVGSSPDSAICLHDATVSRLHAELEVRNDGLWIRDLGSRNGTFVNGLRVSGALVPDQATVQLGALEISVKYGEATKKVVAVWPQPFFGRLVGASRQMRELFALLARIAPLDSSVLIQGETGTGKELVARALHDGSSRASKPFVVVDCAALPDNLLDAELFGHAKGAFTGAVGAREGSIEAAEGGTVFLDEIGELPMSMQPKLLRVLESRTVRRVGETSYRAANVRFLSATHRDLPSMVAAGQFREDLYFRLAVVPVMVPPLRARKEDIELLVTSFLRALGETKTFDHNVIRALAELPWRGNVRELRNYVERARALGPEEALRLLSGATVAAAPPTPGASSPPPELRTPEAFDSSSPEIFVQPYKGFREAWVQAGEREYVRRLLERHDRSVPDAAKEAGVDRTYVYRLMRKHML